MLIRYPEIEKEEYLRKIETYRKKLADLAEEGNSAAENIYDENYRKIIKTSDRIERLISIITGVAGIAFLFAAWLVLPAHKSGYPGLGVVLTIFAIFFTGLTALQIYLPKEEEIKKYNHLYENIKEKYTALYEDKKKEYEAACPGVMDKKREQEIASLLEKLEIFKTNNVQDVQIRIYGDAEEKNVFELSAGDNLDLCVMFNFPDLSEVLKPGVLDFSVFDEKTMGESDYDGIEKGFPMPDTVKNLMDLSRKNFLHKNI